MKTREYIELAIRSNKLNKKSNRKVIRGLIIGFTLLIPVLTLLFSVNGSITNHIDKNPYLLNYEVKFFNYRTPSKDFGERKDKVYQIHISGSQHIDYVTDNNNIERSIIYESYDLNDYFHYESEPPMQYSIAGGNLNNIAFRQESYISIIDLDKSDSIFPQNYTEYFPGGIFLKGYDKGFTGKGKQEVIVSENFLIDNELKPDDIYLKTLSVKSHNKMYIEDGYNTVEGYICQNYRIVGIVKAAVAEITQPYGLMRSQMFFTSVNVYDEDNKPVLKPRYIDDEITHKRYSFYDNWDNREVLNKEYMMLGWFFTNFRVTNGAGVLNTCVYAEADSYSQLKAQRNKLDARFAESLGFKYKYITVSEVFESYSQLYGITNIITFILLFVCIAIGFSSLLDLFSSIHHNISRRREYLTMMRALGAKDRDIPRLYITESAVTCAKAVSIIGIFGFLLSAGMKIIYELYLHNHLYKYRLVMPWWIIVLTTVVTVVIVLATSVIFSYYMTKKLSKQNIPSILNS